MSTDNTVLSRVLIVSALAMLMACGTVPITGRSQLNLVTDKEVILSANASFAKFIGSAYSNNAVLQASESESAASTLAMVKRVSDRIIDAAGLRGRYNWETVVIKSKNANAFVMPNGKIVVFTGLLPITKNEAGLAAVIGHEVAHVVARHSAERMSHVFLSQTVLTVTDAAMAAKNTKYQPAISAALGLGAQYGVLLPFSREHESEADHIGLLYMAKAGYDPAEAIGVWQRMELSAGTGPWEMLSTHPNPATRRARLRAWQPDAALFYADRGRPLPTNLAELEISKSSQSSKSAGAPTALAPDVRTGFWFTMHSSRKLTDTTYRVERKEPCSLGECLFIVGDNGSSATISSSFELLKSEDTEGVWIQYSPPLRQIKFPLTVGDSWNDSIATENSAGRKQQFSLKFEVISYEPVTVKAGQFLAYRIVGTLNGNRFSDTWYEPETGIIIRSVTAVRDGSHTISELVDYLKNSNRSGDL